MAAIRKSALQAVCGRVVCVNHRIVRPTVTINQTRTFLQQQRPRAPRLALSSLRFHSNPSADVKIYDFQQVKDIVASPSEDRILIDVREPSEFEAGYIPSAINIPVKTQPDALFLPEEEFESRFGFEKPAKDTEVIFYCRAGVRSNAAAQLAKQNGYEKISEYRGSWLDWEKNGGETSKP